MWRLGPCKFLAGVCVCVFSDQKNLTFISVVVLTWHPNGGTKFCPSWLMSCSSLAEKCLLRKQNWRHVLVRHNQGFMPLPFCLCRCVAEATTLLWV